MRYFIFKNPRKPGDQPVKSYNFEPQEFQIGLDAKKFGPIQIVSQEELDQEKGGL